MTFGRCMPILRQIYNNANLEEFYDNLMNILNSAADFND